MVDLSLKLRNTTHSGKPSTHTNSTHAVTLDFIYIGVGLVILGFTLRSIALWTLPAQWLEGMHLFRAEMVLDGNVFNHPISMRKWLSVPAVAYIMRPHGPESLWLARIFSSLVGVLNIAVCMALGRILFHRKVGMLAGLLYAVIPIAVFHERQALSDPLFTTLVTLATLLTYVFARKPRLSYGLLLGFTLGGAYLAKVAALPYLLLPGLAILLFTKRTDFIKACVFYALSLLIAAGLVVLAYSFYYRANPQDYGSVGDAIIKQITGLSPGGGTPRGGFEAALTRQLADLADISQVYVGWLAFAFATAAAVLSAFGNKWRKQTLYVAFPAFVFLLPTLASGLSAGRLREPYLPARYLTHNAIPLVVLASVGVAMLVARVRRANAKTSIALTLVIIAAIMLPYLRFDARYIADPSQVTLTKVDHREYISGSNSGYGQDEVAQFLLEETGGQNFLALVDGNYIQIAAYVGYGGEQGTVRQLPGQVAMQYSSIAQHLARGEKVFILNQLQPYQADITERVPDMTLVERRSIPTRSGLFTVNEVVAAQGDLAVQIYNYSVPEPSLMAGEFAAIEPTVSGSDVYVFPPNQTSGLSIPAKPLNITEWPLTQDIAEKAVAELGTDGSVVAVILVDEIDSDPHRYVATALQTHLYWMDESIEGLLRRQRFATGPLEPVFQPVGGVFEDAIHIDEAAFVDPDAQPGQVVRFAFRWSTDVPIADNFTVFTHLFDPQLNLIAQSLNVPGNNLFPMTDWQPGEVIEDRYAFVLPQDLPPGEYPVWVGVTDEGKGLRLGVTDGIEVGDNYVVAGRFKIAQP